MGKGTMIRKYLLMRGPEEALRLISRLLGSDGGPGSGNFGHKGRPGKVGGSGGGGGSAFRTTTPGGAYVGVQKAAAFKGIKKVAQKSKDADEFIDSLSKEQRDMIVQQHRQIRSKERIMDYTERLRQLMCAQKPEKTVQNKIVEGKDISATCEWNGKPYTESMFGQTVDTNIEHVIVSQGFNGPPKVLSQKEFLEHIEKHPQMPVLFRSYAALGEEAVQAYDDMLENGEWYVDCSNGGAQYGQGMYCAGVYGSRDYSGALSEMAHYRSVSMKNARERWYPQLAEGEDCIKLDGKSIVYKTADMKKTEENEPPEVQDVIGVVKFTYTTETVKGYFMPADPEDDDSPLDFCYYTDGGGWQTVPAEKVPYWGPIDRTETPPPASASTRMMTLDPSAKIITYKEAADLYNGRLSDEMKAKFYLNKLSQTENELRKSGLSDNEITYFSYAYKAKNRLGHIDLEDWKKVAAGISEERKEELKRNAEQKSYEHFQEMEDQREERANKAFSFRDIGAYMAALGYDAINAEGHGNTQSYTVVLNRTKLIISQSRVDVAS